MFAPQWSIKGEYLYYDLGTVAIDQTLDTFDSSGWFSPPLLFTRTRITMAALLGSD